MPATASPEVTLFVRSLASRTGRQDQILDRLDHLETAGHIDSFDVHIWGEEISLSSSAVETARGKAVLERISEFRQWANRNEVSLDRFFENRERTSRLTGKEQTTLRLPGLAMAEYEGDELEAVTPHIREGSVRTVSDRLAMLSNGTEENSQQERVRAKS